MAGAAERLMEADEFLAWCAKQEGRYELVDGEIVAMAGASDRHDQIVVNITAALHGRLKGKPCRPRSADFAVRTKRRIMRRPDVLVDCGDRRNDMLEASQPTAVFEVLSPSTRQIDLVKKLNEYRALAGLLSIVLIEQAAADVVVYSRNSSDENWTELNLQGLDGVIELASLSVSLPMTEIYADVAFDPE